MNKENRTGIWKRNSKFERIYKYISSTDFNIPQDSTQAFKSLRRKLSFAFKSGLFKNFTFKETEALALLLESYKTYTFRDYDTFCFFRTFIHISKKTSYPNFWVDNELLDILEAALNVEFLERESDAKELSSSIIDSLKLKVKQAKETGFFPLLDSYECQLIYCLEGDYVGTSLYNMDDIGEFWFDIIDEVGVYLESLK